MNIFYFEFSIVARALVLAGLPGLVATGCSTSQPESQPAADQKAVATSEVSTDLSINAILERSCYSCHSTGGTAPWYAAVSPTYLAAGSARKVLNFSEWETYDADKKTAELKSIVESVRDGSMPPGDYAALDHWARLSDNDKQSVLAWASRGATSTPAHQ
jgi:hypothetical protein